MSDMPADGEVCDVLLSHGAVCAGITYRHCLRWLIRGTFPLDAQVVGWRPADPTVVTDCPR